MMRLVMFKTSGRATFRHRDLTLTVNRNFITWQQDITRHRTVSLSFSQDIHFKTTHCHSNLFNHKTLQRTFHPTTHCQWLNKLHRDKTQIQATLSTNLLKQLQVLHLNNDPKILQHYSSPQQRTHELSTAMVEKSNLSKTFFELCLKCHLKRQR